MQRAFLSGAAVSAFVALCVLGLNRPEEAFSQQPQQPFANAVQQRAEGNELLKEIRDLLREQNALLQKGLPRMPAPVQGAAHR